MPALSRGKLASASRKMRTIPFARSNSSDHLASTDLKVETRRHFCFETEISFSPKADIRPPSRDVR